MDEALLAIVKICTLVSCVRKAENIFAISVFKSHKFGIFTIPFSQDGFMGETKGEILYGSLQKEEQGINWGEK